jgi:hypothetical protein
MSSPAVNGGQARVRNVFRGTSGERGDLRDACAPVNFSGDGGEGDPLASPAAGVDGAVAILIFSSLITLV